MSSGTFTQLHYHVIFAVKFRQGLLAASWRERLYAYMGGILTENHHKPLLINGVEDHVHLAFGMRPTQALSDLIGTVKRASSRWVTDARLTPGRFEWQEGYGGFAVSRSHLSNLLKYIEEQESHHQHESFHDEYKRILKQLHIPHDERFLFKPVQ